MTVEDDNEISAAELIGSGKYTYMDFGASTGGSLTFAATAFGGHGFGIDISKDKIRNLRKKGLVGVVADAAKIDIPDNSVDYVTMMDFLEHLPNRESGEAVIDSAVRIARKFVFIVGPNFDSIEYLKDCGFKKFYCDWSGHTWHHSYADMLDIARKHKNCRACILQLDSFTDSNSSSIHPLTSPRNSGSCDPAKHPPKSFFRFDRNLHNRIVVLLIKDEAISPGDIFIRSQFSSVFYGRDTFRKL